MLAPLIDCFLHALLDFLIWFSFQMLNLGAQDKKTQGKCLFQLYVSASGCGSGPKLFQVLIIKVQTMWYVKSECVVEIREIKPSSVNIQAQKLIACGLGCIASLLID